MLGGTDLALAFDEGTAGFPLVDCAGILGKATPAVKRTQVTRCGSLNVIYRS